jgi:hypothetical protein
MDARQPNYDEERLSILRMIEDGKISAEEGISLLNALGRGAQIPLEEAPMRPEPPQAPEPPEAPLPPDEPAFERSMESGGNGGKPHWFKVRVTDTNTGKAKASVTIPLGLMDWGLRFGAQFAPRVGDTDLRELNEILRAGGQGKIIDVIDEEDGEHVEIYIE